MPSLADTDILRLRSTHTVGSVDCLGGAATSTEIVGSILHETWDRITETEGVSGRTEFRCFYIKNNHSTQSIKNPIWIIKNPAKSTSVAIACGWGTSAINANEQTIDAETTYPTNVTFKEGDVTNTGAILGRDIPPGGTKAVWIRRQVFFGAQPHADDGYELRLVTDNVEGDITAVEDNVPEPDEKASFVICGNMTQRVHTHRMHAIKKSCTASTGSIAVAVAGSGMAIAKATPSQAGAEITLCESADLIRAMKHTNSNMAIFCNIMDGADGHKMDPEWFYDLIGKEMRDQCHICFGHDDAVTEAIKRHYMLRQRLRRSYYSKDRQNVHWLFMDTSGFSQSWDETSDQYAFVVSDLQKANANPAIDWIFVLSYRAAYGTQTDSATRYLSASFRNIYHPLFEDTVHICFTNYFRNYQRLHCLQYNAGSPDQPTAVHADDEPDYIIPAGQKSFGDGCIWVNIGCGGRDLDDFVTPAASYMVIGDVSVGYVYGYLDNTNKKLTCKYKTKNHSQKDIFTISLTE